MINLNEFLALKSGLKRGLRGTIFPFQKESLKQEYEKTDACKDCILNHRCLGIHHDLINTFLTPNPILKK